MTTQTQDSDVLLTMTDVSKSFPGVKALDHANLTVRSHSVHALMGENGAGKSTLLKCLFGIYAKDEGEILFLGKPVTLLIVAGALNGLILPITLGTILIASKRKSIVGDYKHPTWMLWFGIVAVVVTIVIGIFSLQGLTELFGS